MDHKSEYTLASSKEDGIDEGRHNTCYCRERPWTKTIFTSVIGFFHVGFLYNFGIFFDKLQHEFSSNVALTGWIGSISYCFFMFGTIFTTWLLRHISCRKGIASSVILGSVSLVASSFSPTIICVIVSYGVFFGLSSNILMVSSYEYVVPLFEGKRRASALTVLTLGATIGNFSMSNLIEYILDQFGWRCTFRIFAGILLIVGMGCCAFLGAAYSVRPGDNDDGKMEKTSTSGRTMCFPEVWLFSLATLTCYLAVVFQYVYMASFLESIGLHDQKSATGVTLVAIGDAISKVVIAIVAPHIVFPLIYCVPVSLLLLSVLSLALTWTKNEFVVYALSLFWGLPRGVYNCLQLPTGLEVFGARRSKISVNIVLFWSGVGNLVGPFMHGSLFDLTGSYYPALYLCAALYLISSVTMLLTPLWQKYMAPDRYMVDYRRQENKEVPQNNTNEYVYLEERISVV